MGIQINIIFPNINSIFESSEKKRFIEIFNQKEEESKIKDWLFEKSEANYIECRLQCGTITSSEIIEILKEGYVLTLSSQGKPYKETRKFSKQESQSSIQIENENFTIQKNDSSNFSKIQEDGLGFRTQEVEEEKNKFLIDEINEDKWDNDNQNEKTQPNENIDDQKEKNLKNYPEIQANNNLETKICTEEEKNTKNKIELKHKQYFSVVKDNSKKKDKELQGAKIEEEFIDYIYLFPSEENGDIDTIAINPKILNEEENNMKFLGNLSNYKFFEKDFYIDENDNISFPQWIRDKETFSFSELIVSLFQINMRIKWAIFQISKEKYKLISNKIVKIIYKDIFMSVFYIQHYLSGDISKILSESNIQEQINKVKNDINNLYKEAQLKNEIYEIYYEEFKKIIETEHIFLISLEKEIKEDFGKEKYSKNDIHKKIEQKLFKTLLTFDGWINGRRFINKNIRNSITEYFKPFTSYIKAQIATYDNITKDNIKILEYYDDIVYSFVDKEINNLFNNKNYKFSILKFGSSATGTNIEGSDIDIKIFFENIDIQTILKELIKLTNNQFVISYEIREYQQLITLDFCFEKNMIKDTYKYLQDFKEKPFYYFKDRHSVLRHINVDINYTNNEREIQQLTEKLEKTIEKLKKYPQLVQCIKILKRLIFINFLEKKYYGGISSYSLQSLGIYTIESDIIPYFAEFLGAEEILPLILEKYSNFDFSKYIVSRDSKERTDGKKGNMQIQDPFDENSLFYMGHTPKDILIMNNYISEKDKKQTPTHDFILNKIKNEFKTAFDLFKKEYLDLSSKKDKFNKLDDDCFILKLFNHK